MQIKTQLIEEAGLVTLLTLFSGSVGLALLINSQWWFWLADMGAQQQDEEDDLSHYQTQVKVPSTSPKSPVPVSGQSHQSSGWEFKILRAQHNIFHQPQTLQQVCQEEAQGGWILLEKLDDKRLRFKRPMSFRQKDLLIHNYDPYRSFYGSRWSLMPLFSGVIVLMMTALPAYLAYQLVTLQLSQSPAAPALTPPSSPLLPISPRPRP